MVTPALVTAINTLDNNQETINDSYNFAPGIGYQFNENRTAGLELGFKKL